uniref:Uncharacterized protein n=1 Tax=Glycine max TaxID=3847 RepID=A0A368UIC8_SOYBN
MDIRSENPSSVLSSWRSAWKDSNEDTVYLTAWKGALDQLTTHHDVSSNTHFLCLKIKPELFEVLNKVRSIGEVGLKPGAIELITDKVVEDDVLVGDNDLANWSNHHERIYGDGKDTELIEDDEDSFGRTLGEVVSWGDQMTTECRTQKDDLMSDTCKPEKWLKCSDFDEKSILDCEDIKLTKPVRLIRHDEGIVSDVVGLGCMQVDSFYQDNPKWYDSPCALDTGTDCGDSGFRHGEIL